MYCVNCKIKMNDATAEMEVAVKERSVTVTNVPSASCPNCGFSVIDGVTEKLAEKGAKHCKENTLDFNNIKSIGIGIGKM